jgi:hypothetical protein
MEATQPFRPSLTTKTQGVLREEESILPDLELLLKAKAGVYHDL